MLRLHDTASGAVRPLEQRDEGRVSMYICGPTVYDLPHLGHGRFTLVFDVLRRYLLFSGLDVRYVSNITDIDDNIIARAARDGLTESEVSRQFEAAWWDGMDRLDVLRPTETPHATDYVVEMVQLIAGLLADGHAYELADGVYLDTSTVVGYGLLALQPLESLRAGARVEAVAGKRSPLDFVLWKRAKPGEPVWDAPWGPGRPGWHTECVVMSLDLLGEGFDLHGGGRDLAFPHHENERAQAVAAGRTFARHWSHNGWVEVEGQKMSKSLNNFTSLTDLIERSDARAYRLLVLQSHYRSPIEVTPDTVAAAEVALARLDTLARRFALDDVLEVSGFVTVDGPALSAVDPAALARFVASMDEDLDTPAALAGVFELVSSANAAADAGETEKSVTAARTVVALCGALGLRLHSDSGAPRDAETSRLVAARDAARAAREWGLADAIRDELASAGWTVEDGPDGTVVRR